jgi:hypothetical protein
LVLSKDWRSQIKRLSKAISMFSMLAIGLSPLASCSPAAKAVAGVAAISSQHEATITWGTSVESSSQVEYGITTAYGSLSTLDSEMTLSHIVNLTGLDSSTSYHFRVLSRVAGGN